MPDERCDVPISTGQRDTLVDPSSEVGDTVLEEMVGDLHDVYIMPSQYCFDVESVNG